MRTLPVVAIAGLAVLGLAGCGEVPSDDELRDMEAAFLKTVADRDLDAFMAFWADDAVYMTHGAPTMQGREAIREAWRPLFESDSISLTWEPDGADISRSGDLGFTYGPYRVNVQGPDGTTRVDEGKYTTIWRKDPDGAWKVVLDTGNSDHGSSDG